MNPATANPSVLFVSFFWVSSFFMNFPIIQNTAKTAMIISKIFFFIIVVFNKPPTLAGGCKVNFFFHQEKLIKNQRNIEDFIELIEENSQEMKIQKLIKEDLSFMADYLAEPHEEYICFSNYPIGDKIADFVVLTSRSKMKVCIVEVKGADFKIVKANHYQGLNVHMNDAITQLKNHMEYINRNYSSFRTQIHEDKDKAINEEYSGNYLVGPRKTLLVDPQKDIDVKYIAIGGVEREDKSIEESHEIVKCKPADNLEIASWNSFVRKLDEYHGHHPVQ